MGNKIKILESKSVLPRGKAEVSALHLNVPGSVSSLVSVKIGIDLVEVGKVRKVFEGRKSLQEAVFTPEELRYSREHNNPYIHLAARFAVKEALFKALGTGLSSEVDWLDVEVQKEISGKPVLYLSGKTARVAKKKGVVGHTLSLTHTESHAVALVLLMLHASKRASA